MHRQKLYFTPEAKYSINLIYLYQNTVTESFKIIESSLHPVCTVFAPCLHRVSHRVCTVFGTVFAPCLNRVCTDFEPCFAPCLHRVCTVFAPCLHRVLTFHICSVRIKIMLLRSKIGSQAVLHCRSIATHYRFTQKKTHENNCGFETQHGTNFQKKNDFCACES